MNCEQLHETNIKAITDFIGGAIDGAKEGIKTLKAGEGSNKAWTSIAKATSNMTLVFPVLVSRNMPIETAQLIAKTCERDDVSMLQVLFSALSVAETSDNGIDYIMSVHKNLKLGDKIDLDDFIDTMNSLPMNENAMISYREAYDMVKEDMNNINFTLPGSISETGLNQCKLVRQGSDFLLLEGPAEKDKDIERVHKDIIASTTSSKNGYPKFTQVGDDVQKLYDDITFQDYDPGITDYDTDKILNDELQRATKIMNNNALDTFKNLTPTGFARMTGIDFDAYKAEFNEKYPFPTRSVTNLNDAIKLAIKKANSVTNPDEMIALRSSKSTLDKIAADMFNMYRAQYALKNGDPTKAAYQAAVMVLNGKIDDEKRKHQSKQDAKQAEIDYRKCIKDLRDYNLAVAKYNLDVDKYELDVNKYKEELRQNKIRNTQQVEKDLSDRNSRMLIDTDVKKANELIPTLMNVTFRKPVAGTDAVVASSIVVGVKAKLIPLDASDIAERIVAKNKDNNYFIKFFRATTREISFVKDFIFSIDKAKSDAISFSKKGKSNSIWKVLENRAKLSKAKRIVGKANSAMAISTLIITAEEAEMLKKMHGVDMYNPSTVSSIMRSYNLMAFGIVDDSLETFRFMKDNGENIFETYAYSALEKELRDGAAAKALNIVAKSQR